MDPLTQIALTRQLIDIDSTTGREHDAGVFLATTLRRMGYEVNQQQVAGDRFNVFASVGKPVVVLSTHFDCVPPFFPSRSELGTLYGRGSCDAKGTILAMVAASERLRASGERRVGLLFVVAEERGSEGARTANQHAPGSTFLVDGEPTDNRLGTATRGVYRVKLTASGRAAHSSLPELGESAIEKLLDALIALRSIDWPSDATMGRTHYTVGLVGGGVAPNVIPAAAEAEVMFRTVGDFAEIRRLLDAHVGSRVRIDDVLVVPPVRLKTVDGFDSAAFAFTTDIPWLDRWGTPLLLGPGSVTVAHTDHEHVAIAELHRAAGLYEALARTLMSHSG